MNRFKSKLKFSKSTVVKIALIWLPCMLMILVSQGGYFVHQSQPISKTYTNSDYVRQIDMVSLDKSGPEHQLTICYYGYTAEQQYEYDVYQIKTTLPTQALQQDAHVFNRSEISQGCEASVASSIEHNGFKNSESKPSFFQCRGNSSQYFYAGHEMLGCYRDPETMKNNLELYFDLSAVKTSKVINKTALIWLPVAWLIDLITSPVQVVIWVIYLLMFLMGGGGVPGMP